MSLPSVWFICTTLEGLFHFIFTEAVIQLTEFHTNLPVIIKVTKVCPILKKHDHLIKLSGYLSQIDCNSMILFRK